MIHLTIEPAPANIAVTNIGASRLGGCAHVYTATVEFSTTQRGILHIQGKTRAAAIKAAKQFIDTNGHAAAWDRVEKFRCRR